MCITTHTRRTHSRLASQQTMQALEQSAASAAGGCERDCRRPRPVATPAKAVHRERRQPGAAVLDGRKLARQCSPVQLRQSASRLRPSSVVCKASQLPFVPADLAASVAGACNLKGLAGLVGWVMGAGSLFLFAPIQLRMLRKRSAAGLSVTTWALQLAAFTGSTLYNASKGHPLSAYAEARVLHQHTYHIWAVLSAPHRTPPDPPVRCMRSRRF